MNARQAALIVAMLAATGAAQAADPVYLTLDHSTDGLIDKAGADAIWAESLAGKTAKLNKLYPVKKWGFVSQVEGGFTQSKACVVTARVMMMPVTMGKSLLFKPSKTATAFDTLPGATREQCQDAAKAKLKESIQAVLSSLSN